MPLQKATALRDLCPARGAGPAWASSASLSMTVIVTLAGEPARLAIEHSTSAPPAAVTGGEPSVAAMAGEAVRATTATVASHARLGAGMGVMGSPPEAWAGAAGPPPARPPPPPTRPPGALPGGPAPPGP